MKNTLFAALTGVLLLGAGAVSATPIVFEGAMTSPVSGQGLDAIASFDTFGNDLIVTLSNVGEDVLVPSDILTAVFFNLAGSPSLSSTSAVLGPGSSVLFGSSDPGGVVGGEWAYGTGLAGPNGTSQGISSSGYGVFGGATFPGTNLQGPAAIDGMQYGITSSNDNPATGNSPVTGDNALIQHSVVFTLSGLPDLFDPLVDVSDVWFQYGTSLTEPGIPGDPIRPVPEPGSLLLLGFGLVGMGGVAWKRRRGAKA